MAQQIKKIAIEIAGIIVAIAAIWYALKILTFSSLSESEAKSWLHTSEVMLFASAILLALGLWGEWPESESWKKGLLYNAAKGAVIVGVLGELLGDGGVFRAGDRVAELQDAKITDLQQKNEILEIEAAPRELDRAKFLKTLSKAKKPAAMVELRYQKDAPESWWFAEQIEQALLSTRYDWRTLSPSEIAPEDEPPMPANGMKQIGPFTSGLRLFSNSEKDFGDPTSAASAMKDALLTSVGRINQLNWEADPRLPPDTLKILVSPRATLPFIAPPKP